MSYQPHAVNETSTLFGKEVLVIGDTFAVRGEVVFLFCSESGFTLKDSSGFTYNFTEKQMRDQDIQLYVNK